MEFIETIVKVKPVGEKVELDLITVEEEPLMRPIKNKLLGLSIDKIKDRRCPLADLR